jgi:hypothetical protein
MLTVRQAAGGRRRTEGAGLALRWRPAVRKVMSRVYHGRGGWRGDIRVA